MDKAKKADEALSKGEDMGPLHGLPMTIKDAYSVEGMVPQVETQLGKTIFLKKMLKRYSTWLMPGQLFLEKPMCL
ncbi:MAG: hypothetical protein CM1200mP12_06570 [Gammaproteobacteria bacterium]|nr:MAG: hypothetical protein CM1200mP12_06570 [Gammaproteobacteria bacterium]